MRSHRSFAVLALLGAGASPSCTDGDGRTPKPTRAAEAAAATEAPATEGTRDDAATDANAKADANPLDPCVRACVDERMMQAVSASAIEARCKAECGIAKAPPR
jgi:hypothetical protein